MSKVLPKRHAIARLRLVTVAGTFAFVTGLNAANNYFGIAVNGACHTGTSCPATPLPYNTSNTLAVTYSFTLSNGDEYRINGSSTGSNNSNGGDLPWGATFQVTYEGNASGGASQADSITVDWYVAFETTYGYGNFAEGLAGAFGHTIAAASSAAECANGGSCLGPVTSPRAFSESTTFTEDSSNGVFPFDFQWTLDFAAGSPAGAYIVLGQDTPLRAPAISSFSPSSGSAGVASVVITGANFTGATNVTFHNVAASFTANSATQITATVPCTATTGPIEVTTPGGIANSKTDFTVTGECYSAADNFSETSNPHGAWSYGYASTFGGTFTLLTIPVTSCDTVFFCWANGGAVPNSATVFYDPNQAPAQWTSIILPHNMLALGVEANEILVRWTAPAAGTYTISGSFTGIDENQSPVNVGVYQDGPAALAQGNISSYNQMYAFNIANLTLHKGETIDFAGTDTTDPLYDSVGLIATIARTDP